MPVTAGRFDFHESCRMDIPLSSLKGYAITTEHEKAGTLVDVLFDDLEWKVWWLVVETGSWLAQRRVVVHPGAIQQIDHGEKEIVAKLTRAQIEASPHVPPVADLSRETSGLIPTCGRSDSRVAAFVEV